MDEIVWNNLRIDGNNDHCFRSINQFFGSLEAEEARSVDDEGPYHHDLETREDNS